MFPTTLITGMPPVGGGIRITDQNKGPAVNLVAWITFVVMCLAVLFKIFINLWRNYGNIRLRNLQADDYLITAAMLFALGESIAVSREVPAGIGQHQATLSNYQIISYEKAAYAAEFLYIAALSMARLTVLSLILALASGRTNRTAVVLVGGLTVTWTLSAIFGIAFQCRLPRSWEIISNTCFDQRAFWLGIGIGDVLITLLLIALPIYLLWNLQVPRPKKITIMVAFALRILDIPLIVLRILYIWQADKSADHTFNDYNVVITTQILMNLSIILSCVLFLKPLMNNLQAGWSTSNMRTGLGYNSIIGTGKSNSSYTARSHSYGTKSRSFPMGSVINTGNRNTGIYNKDNNRVCGGLFGGHDPVPTSVTRCEPVAFLDRSSFGSDAMIIKKKVDYTVELLAQGFIKTIVSVAEYFSAPRIMRLFGFGKNEFEVDGKTILLTGGSDGMGKSAAKILAKKGANVVIVARNMEKLRTAIAEIRAEAVRGKPQRFHSISADLSKAGEAIRVIEEVMKWNGGSAPDIVWCLAGASRPTLFLDSTPEQHRQMMDANYWSSADMAHAILSKWLHPNSTSTQPRHLIFTSSVLAFVTLPGYSPYSPTKAALRSLSDTLAQETKLYPSSNIKIHTVFPGTILTQSYEEENKIKPEITKQLESGDPKETPDTVAKRSIEALENGEYLITTGWMGSAMKACSWGGSQRSNWLLDSSWMGVVNLAWPFIRKDLDGKIIKYGLQHGHPSTYSKKDDK